ncbi:glycosyltransferase [Aeromonas caviae]|uniref:glycosyltransferase n=1 Tax=Aeromonas caviae TaxID=648 RepID=UPI0038D0647B
MFTFVSISYNHSDYIVQHLESIKYQIEKYGDEIECEYILCDDNSKDDTVALAECWLKKNEKLFKRYLIAKSSENLGTVKNYLNAISLISTKYCKITASDDIYSKNNIFDAYLSDSIVINFSLPFSSHENNVSTFNSTSRYYDKARLFLMCRTKFFLESYIKYDGSLSGPATYYPTKYLKDDSLSDYLSKYKYVEDRPLWRYLFLNKKLGGGVEFRFEPLVYYRTSVGVTSKNSPAHQLFKKDCELLARDSSYICRMPKYLNPFNYLFRLISTISIIIGFIQKKTFSGKVFYFETTIMNENLKAEAHLKEIIFKAECFKIKNYL